MASAPSPELIAAHAVSGQRSGSQTTAAATGVRAWQGHATLFALAGSSNMCAAAITNPVNVIKFRMQLDGALSSTAERQYPGFCKSLVRIVIGTHIAGAPQWQYCGPFEAFGTIARTEGLRGLYRGVGPTMQRAAILNVQQIPSYDHTKYMLVKAGVMHEGMACHLVSSMTAGLVTAIVMAPIDLIETRCHFRGSSPGTRSRLLSIFHSSIACDVVSSDGSRPRPVSWGHSQPCSVEA